jgi:hypothetical protein
MKKLILLVLAILLLAGAATAAWVYSDLRKPVSHGKSGQYLSADARFPYGDFSRVHRCALLAAEATALEFGFEEIAGAAARLRALIDSAARGEVA